MLHSNSASEPAMAAQTPDRDSAEKACAPVVRSTKPSAPRARNVSLSFWIVA